MDTKELMKAMGTAFIDKETNSNLAYCPEFLSNDYKQGRKVLVSLDKELNRCDEFFISVAFIKMSGITPFLMTLKELEKRGIQGKILTTDYQIFTEPKALDKLAELKNISLKIYRCNPVKDGFHTKGYVFKEDEIYRIIIGSSNMTISAITTNREWNTKIVSTEYGQVASDIVNEFRDLWEDDKSADYEEYIEEYRKKYVKQQIIRKQQRQAAAEEIVEFHRYTLKPNKMQVEFINNLTEMRSQGVDRALLLSSTGTGKTYASAFAMRELGFKKVLFLVHRNQIIKQAIESYRNVFGKSISLGLFSGSLNKKEEDRDYIFATIQTLSKEENMRLFSPGHFDAIIYDEAHHVSAKSYKKVMEYFKPKFTLGMTATPDKRDDHLDGKNIYEIFGHNIAYEIRLQQAMEEDLLCPFHYFGITDLEFVGDGTGKNVRNEEKFENFRYLTCDSRVDYVLKQAKYYGYSGERVKGLIFCSRVDEAKELSRKFNERGLRTMALSGTDSDEVRTEAIERLAMDACDATEERQPLDYILSVDVFSEGTDIVEINQVIMLRPTQSPIVYIQQLGRGLRKAEGKEYVVVLDFIGNYKNNFMVPIALSGDRSYNKDNVRRYIMEGSRIIPGESTLHFDEISKKRIFQAIDNANFSDMKLIKENYFNLKNKLGHIPALADFDKYGEMDIERIFDNQSLGSYYKFLVKYEKEYTTRFTKSQELMIEFVSKKIANGKRVHELILLKNMLSRPHGLIGDMQEVLLRDYGIEMNENTVENIINIMTNEFSSGSQKKTYEKCIFMQPEPIEKAEAFYREANLDYRVAERMRAYAEKLLGNDREYCISDAFSEMLFDKEFRDMIEELVDYGLGKYASCYKDRYPNTNLVLYQKYTYEDVCRLLEWEHNEVPLNIGGYKYDRKTKTFPVFINYDKSDDISDTIKYEDHFTGSNRLIAISKSGRSMQSEDVQNFLNSQERGIDVQLFVRKNKADKISKEFYFLGRINATGRTKEIVMPNTDKTAVEIEWVLDTPIREDIYEYIVNG
ncbi:NgoFVII family restriction endonuclease [Blautia sp. An249]|uniref:DEAD/DEAH box helicase n=1 Tax=Blautia sp. An249 TaxID=1965603 RepID=UPI000B396AA3|nr:DEAD/DEAH box helicase [Blautia sp. An249]OUO76768.1 NgoFVII family restriction endonuclease [Blautia sp. An249]